MPPSAVGPGDAACWPRSPDGPDPQSASHAAQVAERCRKSSQVVQRGAAGDRPARRQSRQNAGLPAVTARLGTCGIAGRRSLLILSGRGAGRLCFGEAGDRRRPILADRARSTKAEALLPATFTNSLGMEFVLVPKGKSWLGGGGGKPGDKEVEITDDFYLGKYEVTQEEWEKVMGSQSQPLLASGRGQGCGEGHPRRGAEAVSGGEGVVGRCPVVPGGVEQAGRRKRAGCIACRRRRNGSMPVGADRLADKFDSAFDFYFDKPTKQLLPEQANFEHGKGLKRTCKVGSYQPNGWACTTCTATCGSGATTNRRTRNGASHRVRRGGGWHDDSGDCRAANRNAYPPSNRDNDLGLRLARVPVGKEPVDDIKPPATDADPHSLLVGRVAAGQQDGCSINHPLAPRPSTECQGRNLARSEAWR